MWIATIDDTGVSFTGLTELARFFGCVPSNIDWYRKKSSNKNHFYYHDIGITLKKHKPKNRNIKYKEYYRTHKDACLRATKKWGEKNKEKLREYREKWRKNHKDWYNAYYRAYNKQRKQGKK